MCATRQNLIMNRNVFWSFILYYYDVLQVISCFMSYGYTTCNNLFPLWKKVKKISLRSATPLAFWFLNQRLSKVQNCSCEGRKYQAQSSERQRKQSRLRRVHVPGHKSTIFQTSVLRCWLFLRPGKTSPLETPHLKHLALIQEFIKGYTNANTLPVSLNLPVTTSV